MDRVALDLQGVPETLLLPLWGRACDARAPRPILGDQHAAALVERLDFDFARISNQLSDYSSLYWARRALLLDARVRAFAAERPGGVVVNIGCGLDTTFQRVDDGKLRWVDLDLPEVVRVRRALLPEGPRNRLVSASVLDSGWLDAVAEAGDLLVVAGGVLFYFDEPSLADFFRGLATRRPGAEIAFDTLSRFGRWMSNAYLKRAGMTGAPLRWAVSHPDEVLAMAGAGQALGVYPIFAGLEPDPARSLALRALIQLTDRAPVGQLWHLRLG